MVIAFFSFASLTTNFETPCAEKMSGAPCGTSFISSINTAPFSFNSSITDLL